MKTVEENAEHAVSPGDASKNFIPGVEAGIAEISRYGNITLDVGPAVLRSFGYEPGDVVSVRIGNAVREMPVRTCYSEVPSGQAVCCFNFNYDGDGVVVLAVNNGNLAETMGIARRRKTDTAPGFRWIWQDGLDASAAVSLSIVKKQVDVSGGDVWQAIPAQTGRGRSNRRTDYPHLSDAEYANFRSVETTGMGKRRLFRSSSPLNPDLNRSREADDALKKAKIRTVLNMSDSEQEMLQFTDYERSNYSRCDVIALDMPMDFFTGDFRKKLAEGLRFLISHDGPYLIHCNEGKDRTGFAVGILACLMGADADEVVRDYMLTFCNLYGIQPGTERYERIAAGNIEAVLERAFGISSIRAEGADLKACAEAYLRDIGMHKDEIRTLKERLS